MRHGSLFSGIGGFELAAQMAGWENVFHCEINPFGQRVLKHHFLNSISYDDITKTDFTIHRGQIDIITGGFPCQPYSQAGKRLGKEDDRHLWPQMLRVIREIQPRWVVGENVFGIVNWNDGVVFDEVQADLEAAGYEVQPYVLPACAVNAPHRRDRVWFVAYRDGGSEGPPRTNRKTKKDWRENNDEQKGGGTKGQLDNGCGKLLRHKAKETTSNSHPHGLNKRNSDNEVESSQRGVDALGNVEPVYGDVTDAMRTRGRENIGIRESRLANKESKRYNFQNFPTQSPICGGNDGLPTELDGITFSKWRKQSIEAYGNAIVPQAAYQIFKAINEYERLT
jgi:DNA (cytosine-5)-methyltransferase 1